MQFNSKYYIISARIFRCPSGNRAQNLSDFTRSRWRSQYVTKLLLAWFTSTHRMRAGLLWLCTQCSRPSLINNLYSKGLLHCDTELTDGTLVQMTGRPAWSNGAAVIIIFKSPLVWSGAEDIVTPNYRISCGNTESRLPHRASHTRASAANPCANVVKLCPPLCTCVFPTDRLANLLPAVASELMSHTWAALTCACVRVWLRRFHRLNVATEASFRARTTVPYVLVFLAVSIYWYFVSTQESSTRQQLLENTIS